MLEQNDTVLYGTTGVCKVEGLIEKEVARVKKPYYVLRPVSQANSAVYVPADNPTLLAKIKRILSKEEIYELLSRVPREPKAWIEDNNRRRDVFGEILNRGNRLELLCLVREIYLHQKELVSRGKRLHLVDERVMKEAERLLYEEFSLALEMDPDQVIPFIAQKVDGTAV